MNAFEKTASIYEQAGFYKEAGLAAGLTKEQMTAARPASEMPGDTRRNVAAWNSHPLNKGRQSAYVTHAGVTYKTASVYEIYKEAGFGSAVMGAVETGAKAIGHQVGRAGAAMQRTAFQASKGVPTAGQSMLHSAGQGVRNLGKGIAANPGTAAGVAGVGLAGMGAAGMAGRMTAPRPQ